MYTVIIAYWMRFSMTGQDGNAVITVECADTEDTHSPNDLEKVCTTNRDLYMLMLVKGKSYVQLIEICTVCAHCAYKRKWSVHAAQLIIVYKHIHVHCASVSMIGMCVVDFFLP